MPKGKTEPRPTVDSPENIAKCLCCELEECNDCLRRNGRKKKLRKEHVLNFFGKTMTIGEIAKATGLTYKRIYAWNRYGGESWVEERAKKYGYKPKGE